VIKLPGSVAVLINNRNTIWEKDIALPTKTGSALLPGKLRLRAGVAEIAFHAGGEVLLEGPADFDISAADQGYLHRGKLTAKVPGGDSALRVSMPGVVVTDRSGECGLLRDELGLTEVHVFESRVEADTIDRQGKPLLATPLAENAAARIDDAKQALMPVPLNEQAFAPLRPEAQVRDAAVRAGRFVDRNFGTVPRLVVKNSIADYTWLVQQALAGDKKLTLRIFAPNFKRGNSDVEDGSRKGEAEMRPQLLIMSFRTVGIGKPAGMVRVLSTLEEVET